MSDSPTETPVFEDEMQEMTFKHLSGFIKERNSLVGTANAANGDRLDLTEQLTEESTDPEIVEAREARDEAIMRLDALVRPKVEDIIANAGTKVEEAVEKIKEIDGKLKPGISYYKKLYGDAAADALPAQVRQRGTRVGSAGTGGRRVRGFNVIVTYEGEVQEFENFASAAKWLVIDTATLQNAFFEAAGNPAQVKDAPDKVSFNIEVTETDDEGNKTTVTASVLAERTEPTADNSDSE